MYKSRDNIVGRNQEIYVQSHASEMVKEQERINDSLKQTILGIRTLNEQQHLESENKWTYIETQLEELQHFNMRHEIMGKEVGSYLTQLEKDNIAIRELIEADQLAEQVVRDQLSEVNSSYQGIAEQLEEVAEANNQLRLKVDNQTNFQEKMSEQLSVQEESSEKIGKRMDNQEALTEKLVRQVGQFRSLLFERTNYLTEKIEEASGYIQSTLTNREYIQMNYLQGEDQKRKVKSK